MGPKEIFEIYRAALDRGDLETSGASAQCTTRGTSRLVKFLRYGK